MEGGEVGDDGGSVVGEGDAEPLVGSVEDFDGGLLVGDEVIDSGGDKEFVVRGVEAFLKELKEGTLGVGEEVRGEAPEVHGDGGIDLVVPDGGDGAVLFDFGEEAIARDGADASGDGAKFGEGMLELVGDHGVEVFGV